MYLQYGIILELLVIIGLVYPVIYAAAVAVYNGKNGVQRASLLLTVFCELFLGGCVYLIYFHMVTYPNEHEVALWVLLVSLAGCIVGLDSLSVALNRAEMRREKQSDRRTRNFLLDKLMK